MEGYLSEIRYWGPTWSPRNWASCSGQTMPISSFNALFSLIGTLYGGDGRTTFLLPDLRGRVAVGAGAGIALTPRSNGQRGGSETVTLNSTQIPTHNHAANTILGTAQLELAKTGQGTTGTPAAGFVPGDATDINGDAINLYANNGNDITSPISGSATTTIFNNGGSQFHFNVQPYETVLPIICLSGIYPSRN